MFLNKYSRYIILICAVSMAQAGCSISYSFEKSSDSVSTSLDSLTSISTSSVGGKEAAKVEATSTVYQEDVAAVTVLYVSREKTTDDYQRQVSAIAKNHGISGWEQEKSTFLAMGKGLRRAGVSEESIPNLPFFSSIAGSTHYSSVITGYKM